MNTWSWDELGRTAGGSWIIRPGRDAVDFAGVSIDSRSLDPGQVFFAFIGEQADGHDYLQKAAQLGAAACVVTHPDRVPAGFGLPTLVVDDPQRALNDLASAWRDRLCAKVIAITGSNGKTTACRMMHAICAAAGTAFVSPKSFNNALGVPITILNTPIGAEFLIAEAGMSTPGEIQARTRTLRPDIAVITSIGRAHMQAFGSIDGIAQEKAQLIIASPELAVGVIPRGIEVLEAALAGDAHRIVRMPAGFALMEVDQHASRFTIDGAEFTVPLPGAHNAHNAALCVLGAREMGIDDATIRSGLAGVTPPAMRFERIEIATPGDPIVIINDAYNANPDSMRAALGTFESLRTTGAKVVVLGEMLEMGDSGPAEHQALSEHAAGLGSIDRLELLGEGFALVPNAQPRLRVHPDTGDERIAAIAAEIRPGDTVLIKASRGVRLERLIDKLSDLHANRRSDSGHTGTRTHA